MGELGFFGANLKGYGCAGMSNVEYGLVMQELERGDSRRALVRQRAVGAGDVSHLRLRQRGAERKPGSPHCRKAKSSAASASPSPTSAQTPAACAPAQRKIGNDYVLNGEKMWITSGSIADVAVIWAKVDDEGDKVRGFLVETDRPGFKADDVHGKWSLRASVTSGLSLQDVRIPASNLLPETGGLKSR